MALINQSDRTFTVSPGDRIAQLVIGPVILPVWEGRKRWRIPSGATAALAPPALGEGTVLSKAAGGRALPSLRRNGHLDRKGMVFMVILASQSPRRRQLLSYITEDFQVIPSQAEEAFSAWEKASLSGRDGPAAFPVQGPGHRRPLSQDLVIGADTIVSVDGHVLEKPADRDDAFHMLKLLSGREHTVCTGVTVVGHSREESFVECSQVRFCP